MAFTTVMSTTSDFDTEVTLELITEFELAYGQTNVVDPFVQFNQQINAKSVAFPIFSLLSAVTSSLTEDADVTSSAMSDSEVILTPAEYGNVVTTTNLANLQSGGRTALGTMRVIGENMGHSTNKIATLAMEASSNLRRVNDRANDGSIVAGDVISATELNKVYNKLARASVPVHPITGTYVAFIHDDVIHDLREGSAAGSWTDVNKYNNEIPVLMNEVGMYKGFRIIRNNDCLLNADAGSGGTVDVYSSSFLGFNGLGLASSQNPEIRITGPFDKLGRFVNVGWYGVFNYKIVQSSAVWVLRSSSSVGSNT